MSDVIRIATAQDKPKTRACADCRLLLNPNQDPNFWRCAIRGGYVGLERSPPDGLCGPEAQFYEYKPTPPYRSGIFVRAWRFLFGGRGDE
jgi:hypothetical protein